MSHESDRATDIIPLKLIVRYNTWAGYRIIEATWASALSNARVHWITELCLIGFLFRLEDPY